MPCFFFHLRHGEDLIEDSEGMELPDVDAVLDEAVRTIRELAADPPGVDGLEFEITDSAGWTVLKVPVHGGRHTLLPLPSGAKHRGRH